jgi:hypothetical protein
MKQYHSRVVSNLALHSGRPGFKSLETKDLDWVFVVSLSPHWEMLGQYLKVTHDHFFPQPFQLIIY